MSGNGYYHKAPRKNYGELLAGENDRNGSDGGYGGNQLKSELEAIERRKSRDAEQGPTKLTSTDYFPWLEDFRTKCQYSFAQDPLLLVKLIESFNRNLSSNLNDCYKKPQQAAKLKELVREALLLFVYFRRYAPKLQGRSDAVYLEQMSDLLAVYIDLELVASKANSVPQFGEISSRIVTYLRVYLDNSEEHLLDTILKVQLVSDKHSHILDAVISKILKFASTHPSTGDMYARHLLVYRLWRRIHADPVVKRQINASAVAALRSKPPADLDAFLREQVLPRPDDPATGESTKFYLSSQQLDLRQACARFLRYSRRRRGGGEKPEREEKGKMALLPPGGAGDITEREHRLKFTLTPDTNNKLESVNTEFSKKSQLDPVEISNSIKNVVYIPFAKLNTDSSGKKSSSEELVKYCSTVNGSSFSSVSSGIGNGNTHSTDSNCSAKKSSILKKGNSSSSKASLNPKDIVLIDLTDDGVTKIVKQRQQQGETKARKMAWLEALDARLAEASLKIDSKSSSSSSPRRSEEGARRKEEDDSRRAGEDGATPKVAHVDEPVASPPASSAFSRDEPSGVRTTEEHGPVNFHESKTDYPSEPKVQDDTLIVKRSIAGGGDRPLPGHSNANSNNNNNNNNYNNNDIHNVNMDNDSRNGSNNDDNINDIVNDGVGINKNNNESHTTRDTLKPRDLTSVDSSEAEDKDAAKTRHRRAHAAKGGTPRRAQRHREAREARGPNEEQQQQQQQQQHLSPELDDLDGLTLLATLSARMEVAPGDAAREIKVKQEAEESDELPTPNPPTNADDSGSQNGNPESAILSGETVMLMQTAPNSAYFIINKAGEHGKLEADSKPFVELPRIKPDPDFLEAKTSSPPLSAQHPPSTACTCVNCAIPSYYAPPPSPPPPVQTNPAVQQQQQEEKSKKVEKRTEQPSGRFFNSQLPLKKRLFLSAMADLESPRGETYPTPLAVVVPQDIGAMVEVVSTEQSQSRGRPRGSKGRPSNADRTSNQNLPNCFPRKKSKSSDKSEKSDKSAKSNGKSKAKGKKRKPSSIVDEEEEEEGMEGVENASAPKRARKPPSGKQTRTAKRASAACPDVDPEWNPSGKRGRKRSGR